MPPQGGEVPIVGGGDDPMELSDRDIREALLALARAVTTQLNLSMAPRENVVESTLTSRLRDFISINPPIFLVSKVGEDPQEFIDEVYKIVHGIGITSRIKQSWICIN